MHTQRPAVHLTLILSGVSPHQECGKNGFPFSTVVSFWGQTSLSPSGLPPDGTAGARGVNAKTIQAVPTFPFRVAPLFVSYAEHYSERCLLACCVLFPAVGFT